MNRRAVQVFFAIALGVFMGLIGAWKAAPALGSLFWVAWLGGVVGGGALAYILYDPVQFGVGLYQAVLKTWQDFMTSEVSYRLNIFRTLFRPLLWNAVGILIASLWVPLVSLIFYFAEADTTFIATMRGGFIAMFVIGFLVISFTSVAECVRFEELKTDEARQIYIREMYELGTHCWQYFNPVVLIGWWLSYALVKSVPHIVPFGLFAASLLSRSFSRFLWNLYVAIHSDARLICFADAALFVALFVCFESFSLAILAALLGGVWGVINYTIVARHVCRVSRVEVT